MFLHLLFLQPYRNIWNILLLELRLTPALLPFQNNFKPGLCQLTWCPNRDTLGWEWLMDREKIPTPVLPVLIVFSLYLIYLNFNHLVLF